MKKLLSYLLFALALVVNYLPLLLGAGFVLTMLIAGAVGLVAGSPWAMTVLQLGWKAYLALALLTLVVMTTFIYQNCCIGMGGFWRHLGHAKWKNWLESIGVALLWPLGWWRVDQAMRGWGMTYLDIVANALDYWLVQIWRGVTLETWTLRNGSVESVKTTRVPSDGR